MKNITIENEANRLFNKHKALPGAVNQMVTEYQADNTNEELKEKILANVIKFIIYQAKTFQFIYRKLEVGDFISVGYQTLNKCFKYYKEDSGVNFSSFLVSNMKKDMSVFGERYNTNLTLPDNIISIKKTLANPGGVKLTGVHKGIDGLCQTQIEDYVNEGNNFFDQMYYDRNRDFDADIIDYEHGIKDVWKKYLVPAIQRELKATTPAMVVRNNDLIEKFELVYGIINEQVMTFADVAKVYNVTREKIRQDNQRVLIVIQQLVKEKPNLRDVLFQLIG